MDFYPMPFMESQSEDEHYEVKKSELTGVIVRNIVVFNSEEEPDSDGLYKHSITFLADKPLSGDGIIEIFELVIKPHMK
jgi:hypothetical protein